MRSVVGAAIAAVVMGGAGAIAAPVTYGFTGSWEGIPFSGPFSGTFSYDPTAAVVFDFGNEAAYEGIALTLDVFGDGTNVISVTTEVAVVDRDPADLFTDDVFAVYTRNEADPGMVAISALIPGGTATFLQVTLLDSNRQAFADTSLPLTLDIADFDGAELRIGYRDAFSPFNSGFGVITSFALVTPEAEVPLPAGLPLLAAGLGALALLRRRKMCTALPAA